MSQVIVRISGGLGNQMFQYAAGRSVATRHGVPLLLDLSSYQSPKARPYDLHHYPLRADVLPVPARPTSGIARLLRPSLSRAKPEPGPLVYREPHHHFDPALFDRPRPLVMDGYWQSWRYFADIADEVARDLTPLAPLDPANRRMADQIASCVAVAVHVRRGDYVSKPRVTAFHGLCGPDYYAEALRHMLEAAAPERVFVFSDDLDWVREHMSFPLPATFVDVNAADRGYRDIQLMSLCRHHVIANSSFSWWGAWLARHPGQVVVGPKAWFQSPTHDTSDVMPPTWVRL